MNDNAICIGVEGIDLCNRCERKEWDMDAGPCNDWVSPAYKHGVGCRNYVGPDAEQDPWRPELRDERDRALNE